MSTEEDIQIVLVEDSVDDMELTVRSLKSSNLVNKIVWLKDGEEATHYFKGEGKFEGRNTDIKPRLVLLDLKLPKLNGIEVLESIKSDSNLKSIPVVMMTSSNQGSDLERCYELGANSYVVKPIDFKEFTEVAKSISLYWLLINELPQKEFRALH